MMLSDYVKLHSNRNYNNVNQQCCLCSFAIWSETA